MPLQPRMPNPAFAVPGAMAALQALGAATDSTDLPPLTRQLVLLRASQLNGCGVCCVQHPRDARAAGETDDRIDAVAGWRDAPYFDDAERAALELAETMTRLADHGDQVPDALWAELTTHYGQDQLAALVLIIATVNLWNRLNVTTRQVAGVSW